MIIIRQTKIVRTAIPDHSMYQRHRSTCRPDPCWPSTARYRFSWPPNLSGSCNIAVGYPVTSHQAEARRYCTMILPLQQGESMMRVRQRDVVNEQRSIRFQERLDDMKPLKCVTVIFKILMLKQLPFWSETLMMDYYGSDNVRSPLDHASPDTRFVS
jgi:hypothetical protein